MFLCSLFVQVFGLNCHHNKRDKDRNLGEGLIQVFNQVENFHVILSMVTWRKKKQPVLQAVVVHFFLAADFPPFAILRYGGMLIATT